MGFRMLTRKDLPSNSAMSSVRSKNTGPEMIVRKLVHSLGYRYRLHRRDLPGTPDLVFSSRHKLIYVNGCFWHLHRNCQKVRIPKNRLEYWGPKLEGNRARDQRNYREARRLGWDVLIIWECELADVDRLERTIRGFLDN